MLPSGQEICTFLIYLFRRRYKRGGQHLITQKTRNRKWISAFSANIKGLIVWLRNLSRSSHGSGGQSPPFHRVQFQASSCGTCGGISGNGKIILPVIPPMVTPFYLLSLALYIVLAINSVVNKTAWGLRLCNDVRTLYLQNLQIYFWILYTCKVRRFCFLGTIIGLLTVNLFVLMTTYSSLATHETQWY
jgi:hypothetical protein